MTNFDVPASGRLLHHRVHALFVAMPMTLSLCACGGGGSGGSVNSTPPPVSSPVQFNTFAAVQANTPTSASGITREGTVSIENTGAILQSGVSTPTEGTGSVTFTLNGSRQATALQISGSQSTVNFNSSNANSAALMVNGVPVAALLSNASGSEQAIFADPYVLGFNHQTFGVWGTGLVRGATGRVGAISVGNRTSPQAVPTTGSVTYQGVAGGIYTDGAQYRYAANALFVVDFTNRSINFSTRDQTITDILTNNVIPISYLTIQGVMTYGQNSNVFSGSLTANGQTPLRPLSGSGSGVFYGPNANEIGGTFFLRGSTTTLFGGFGGRQ
jgi:hypothetical protein